MRGVIDFFIHRSIFGNLLSAIIIIAGIFSFANMQRDAFGTVDFDIVLITTIYPGASPQEVEKLVTLPLEREIKSVEGIKKITSSSIDSRSGVVLTLEPDLKDKARTLQEVRDAADRAKFDFPDDAEEPMITEITSARTPIIEIAINSRVDAKPGLNEWELRDQAKLLQEKLERIDEVALVVLGGYRDREVRVEIDPIKMTLYNISAEEIVDALRVRNLNFPGGNVIDKGREYSIRTVKEFQESGEIEDVILRQNDFGGAIRLSDVAEIIDDFEKQNLIQKANGKEAIILTVLKKESADAINLVDRVHETLDDFKENEALADLEMSTMNDLSYFIRRRLSVLTGNVGIGIVLVLSSLFFFMGWRVALMVAFGIPFSFAITLIVMHQLGISVNLISMFGLIIVSGMIVDDAIVVGENIYRLIEKGVAPMKAAIMGAQEMLMPVVAAVSTTIVAFLPLMFMGGIMGKFIWALPAAVMIALGASLLESFFILPSHVVDITTGVNKENIVKKEDSRELRFFQFLQRKYRTLLEFSLRNSYAVLIFFFFAFIFSIALIRVTGFSLFPKGNIEIFFAQAEAGRGVSIQEMNRRMALYEKAVLALPENELDSFNTKIGIHQEDPNDPFTKRGNHYAQIAVYLTPETQRDRKASDIISFMNRQLDHRSPVVFSQLYADRYLVHVTNLPEVYIFDLNNMGAPPKRIALEAPYFAGAGIQGNRLLLYAGDHRLHEVNLDTRRAKVAGVYPFEVSDIPGRFIIAYEPAQGLLLDERGNMYSLQLPPPAPGEKESLPEKPEDEGSTLTELDAEELESFSDKITSWRYLPHENLVMLTTDAGSLEFWSFNDGELELQKEITETVEPLKLAEKGAPHINDPSEIEVGENGQNGEDGVTGATPPDEREQRKVALQRVEFASGNGVEFHNTIYLSTFDGFILKYDRETEEIVEAYQVTEKPITWLRPHTNGKQTSQIWYTYDSTLALYDMEKRETLYKAPIAGTVMSSASTTGRPLYFLGESRGVYRMEGPRLSVVHKPKRDFEKVSFKQVSGGPPVGDPVSIEVRGDQFETLLELAEVIKNKLATIPGVFDIRDNWERGKVEYHAIIDEKKASLSGVSVFQLASTLQTAFDGKVATSIKKMDEEIEIRVIFNEELRNSIDSLNKVMVRNRIGNLVPITQLARFEKHPGVAVITHDNLKRTLYVRANIDERKSSAVEVNTVIMKMMEPVMKEKKYIGYNLSGGGEYEDTQESMGNLVRAAGVAIAGIGLILVMLFGNMRHPRVIMLVIPLGIIGVSIAFFFHKIFFDEKLVFSFLASLGVVGLTGVVVNDSIVMVDFINKLRRLGFNRHDSIVSAGIARLRPVILTTITTVFGLLPTAYGLGGNDPFLKPMALAMAWGLMFATMITLIVVPAYYSIWEDRGYVFHSFVKNQNKGYRWEEKK